MRAIGVGRVRRCCPTYSYPLISAITAVPRTLWPWSRMDVVAGLQPIPLNLIRRDRVNRSRLLVRSHHSLDDLLALAGSLSATTKSVNIGSPLPSWSVVTRTRQPLCALWLCGTVDASV